MEVSELVLWIARLLVLVLMYAFLLALVFALVADARAAKSAVPPGMMSADVESSAAAHPQMPERAVSLLEVKAGTPPVTGRSYPLYGPLEIGRSATCEISIPSRIVSSRHARIFPQEGGWMLQDLGSTNGTLINGEPLNGAHRLQPGDRVTVGDTEFEAA